MKKLDILHQDEDLVIVNKPAKYLSIPDRFDKEKPNILTDLRKKFESIYTVHRLDKETSGVICFARNEQAHKDLSKQFLERSIQKIYHLIVEGTVYPVEGEITQPIGPHPAIAGKMMVTNKGKASLTVYKVVEQFKNYALVEADIKTGRTHQIRVHFESIGFPLMVDAMYGSHSAFKLSQIKHKGFRLGKGQEERPLMSRSALHAHQLSLCHPTTKESLTVNAPPPKDFRAVLKQLHKWNK